LIIKIFSLKFDIYWFIFFGEIAASYLLFLCVVIEHISLYTIIYRRYVDLFKELNKNPHTIIIEK